MCTICRAAGTRPTGAGRRKPVTVLFGDLVDSTGLAEQLDVETYGEILLQLFDLAKSVIIDHGGQVEKFIGDAVFAVFGLGQVSGDDASRAVAAAVEIQRELLELNRAFEAMYGCRIELRIGLNTGEIVVKEQTLTLPLLAGDVSNIAARLQAVGDAGQVVISEATRQALATPMETTALGPVPIRGRREPVPAHVVQYSVGEPAEEPPPDGFVGRAAELAVLRSAFEMCCEHRRWEVAIVSGRAGIGKSRLVERFVADITTDPNTDANTDAMVVHGRCRADGEGSGLAPISELVDALMATRPRTRSDLRYGLSGLLASSAVELDLDAITRSVGSLLDMDAAPTSVPEIAWSVRSMIEAVAADRPVVVVLEDLHLAKPPVLAMLESMISKAGVVPVLLICLLRTTTESDDTPTLSLFANDQTMADDLISVAVAPLADEETEQLVDDAALGSLTGGVVAQVIEEAQGLPLFIEQVLPMLGDGDVVIPAGVEALVHARLDALPTSASTCLERVAVAGRSFGRSSVQALMVDIAVADDLEPVLADLIDRELLVEIPGEDGEAQLSFVHDSVRGVAYGRTTKHERAELHRRYGDWLDSSDNGRYGANDEMVGFHFEQAYRFRSELSSVGPAERVLAERAAGKFHAAALTALGRSDLQGAASLLWRCRDLSSERDRLAVEPLLGAVMGEAGRLREGLNILDAQVANASERGERLAATLGLLESMIIRMQTDPTDVSARFTALEPELVSVLERFSESAGFARFWHLKALVHWHRVHCEHADAAWRRAAAHAGHVEDRRRVSDALSWRASATFYGPLPSDQGIEVCKDIADQLGEDRLASSQVQLSMACLYAMRGEFEIARFLVMESDRMLDLIDHHLHAAAPHREAFVAVMAGDLMDARSRLAWGIDHLRNIGDRALLSTNAAILAHVLIAEGDMAEAHRLTLLSERAGDIDDIATHIAWRSARAKCFADSGRYTDAVDLANTANEMAADTDCLVAQGDALRDLAIVLRQAEKQSEANRHFTTACDVYEAKGHLIGVQFCIRQLKG